APGGGPCPGGARRSGRRGPRVVAPTPSGSLPVSCPDPPAAGPRDDFNSDVLRVRFGGRTMSRCGALPARNRRRLMRHRMVRVLGLVLVLLVWLVVAAWGGVAQGELSQVQENDDAAFLPESAESTRAAALAEEFTGQETLPALVVVRPEDGGELDRSELEILDRLASTASQLELPDGRSLSDVARAPVVAVPAPDGAAALLTVALDGAQVDEVVGPEDEQLVAVVVDELRALTDDELSGTSLQAWVTGPAGFVADLGSAF